jgi:hypothetical protein
VVAQFAFLVEFFANVGGALVVVATYGRSKLSKWKIIKFFGLPSTKKNSSWDIA